MIKHDHHIDEVFMHRAFELAVLGRGSVSPNPLVGCVIVHDNSIIGEGWHQRYGEAHAEVHAIEAVVNKTLLPQSTAYVTLEPCSHMGKTPPCADLLIKHKLKKVVVANVDSNPLVAGEGIKKMRAAGIEVISGILDKKGRELNARFFTFIEKKRPYIILKWAETRDGFIARENYDSKWISNVYSRQLVHKWRTEEDGIVVGSKTAMHDNPQLNVRDWSGKNPTRIMIDRFLKLDNTLHLLNGKEPTLYYNVLKNEAHHNLSLIRLDEDDFLQNMLTDLFNRKTQSIIIEGGAQTLSYFIEANLWDEARIFIGTSSFGKGILAPRLHGNLLTTEWIGDDELRIFQPVRKH